MLVYSAITESHPFIVIAILPRSLATLPDLQKMLVALNGKDVRLPEKELSKEDCLPH